MGFVHGAEISTAFAHLGQLSVRPRRMRQGVGPHLVRAAMREAWLLRVRPAVR